MILNPTELAADLMCDLPPDVRAVMDAHFVDGHSVHMIQRHQNIKRRDLETMIETALAAMRTELRRRGVRAVSDAM